MTSTYFYVIFYCSGELFCSGELLWGVALGSYFALGSCSGELFCSGEVALGMLIWGLVLGMLLWGFTRGRKVALGEKLLWVTNCFK